MAPATSWMPTTRAAARRLRPRCSERSQTRANLVARPEETAQVLHPLEVRDGDAAGVREDVRQHDDAALLEDAVRLDRCRTVRAFRDQLRLDTAGVLGGDLILAGREHQDAARKLEQLGIRDGDRARIPRHGAVLGYPGLQLGQIESLLAHYAARDVGDGDHRRAAPDQLLRGDGSHIAEPLDDAALLRERDPEPLARSLGHDDDSCPSRLAAEHRAAD